MGLCHLPVVFPFDSVVVQEQRAVVVLDLLRPGIIWIVELIVNELEVNCRNDIRGVTGCSRRCAHLFREG